KSRCDPGSRHRWRPASSVRGSSSTCRCCKARRLRRPAESTLHARLRFAPQFRKRCPIVWTQEGESPDFPAAVPTGETEGHCRTSAAPPCFRGRIVLLRSHAFGRGGREHLAAKIAAEFFQL